MRSPLFADLLLVFLLAFAVRVVWAVLIPPWLAPDEPDHYLYVAFIAEHATLPHPPYRTAPYLSVEQQTLESLALTHELPSGFRGGEGRLLYDYYPINHDYRAVQSYEAPDTDRQSANAGRTMNYPPLYYAVAAIPWRLFWNAPILTRFYLARCVTGLFGALACVFGYLFAYALRPERLWGWAVGMCMAFMPMFVFDSATVNNDAAMICVATALLWLLARALNRKGIVWQDGLMIGVMSGVLLLAKPTALPLVGVAAVVACFKTLPFLGQTWNMLRSKVLTVGGFAIGAIAVYSPWLAYRLYYFGDIGIEGVKVAKLLHAFALFGRIVTRADFSVGAAGLSPIAEATTYSLGSYVGYLQQHQGGPYFYWLMIKTTWGYFGWLDVPLSDATYRVITVFCALAFIGLVIQLVRQPARRAMLLFLVGIIVAQVLFLFVVVDYLESFRATGMTLGLQGRYFFPMLAPFFLLLLSGWYSLLRERPIALHAAISLMFVLQFVALATVLHEYYGVTFG